MKKGEKTQITKIRNENKEVTIVSTEIKMILRDIMRNYMPIKWKTWKKWKNS